MPRTRSWLRVAAVLVLTSQTFAQDKCYYPNGSEAPSTEKPCSSAQGSACCPDTWECLDNGLCHLPAGNLYGTYSCTDKTWKSSGCASNLCTYNNARPGGESMKQCSDKGNQWCCNGDDTNVKCCQESPAPRPFFRLQDGKAYATIGTNQASTNPNLASITGLASSTGSSQTSSTAAGSTARASTTPTPSSARPVTSELTSISSGSAGVQTVVQTLIVTPTSNPTVTSSSSDSSSSGSSKPNIGLIVGCAVGIPLTLALSGIIFWMLRKRRQQKANPYDKTESVNGADSASSPRFAGGVAAKLGKKQEYRHSRPGTSEIDGAPAGPGRPISTLPGRAELDSGNGFQPGHNAYRPDTVGIGGGNGDGRSTWGSAPPGYSPEAHQTAFPQHTGVAELDATSALPVINEKPQQYQAYRPPQPVAEMPSVKTPPEDLEKQVGR